MTTFQKVIRYLAMAFAIFLAVSIIGGVLGAVGLFGGFFEDNAVLENAKTYAVSDDITQLDIEIAAADFTIKKADSFSVESNLKNLKVEGKNGKLIIKETKKSFVTYTNASLVLYVPANANFEKVEIETGAGRFTVDELVSKEIKLELGAGEVIISSIAAAKKAEIEGGAGKITVDGGTLHNLDLDMGVGKLNLTASVTGNSSFDLGIGETNIVLLGNKDNYTIKAEKGIGNITIEGKSVSNFEGLGDGDNRINISGGIGSINLEFKEEQE